MGKERLDEIIRVEKKKHFAVMDKTFLEDSRLSCKAKGILAYLLSKPNDWKVIVADIINHCADGKSAVYAGLKELREYGYYEKVPIRNEAGTRILRWESTVYEVPRSLLADEEHVAEEPIEQMKQEEPVVSSGHHWQVEFTKPKEKECKKAKNTFIVSNAKYIERAESMEQGKDSLFLDFPKIEYEEVQNRDCNNNNYTKYLKDYKNNHNHVLSSQNKTEEDRQADLETTLSVVQENIDYEGLKVSHANDMPLIDEFVRIMVDAILSKGQTVRIGGEEKPRALVKSALMKLNYFHLEHTLSQFKAYSKQIRKKKQYILSMLYNSSMELEAGIVNDVQVGWG